jgi:hypothetical protein
MRQNLLTRCRSEVREVSLTNAVKYGRAPWLITGLISFIPVNSAPSNFVNFQKHRPPKLVQEQYTMHGKLHGLLYIRLHIPISSRENEGFQRSNLVVFFADV